MAACFNKYRGVLNDSNSPEHEAIGQRMPQAQQHRSEIHQLISNNQLSMRKKWIPLMDINIELKFPILSLDFLRKYTCGTYQIKQSKGYAT